MSGWWHNAVGLSINDVPDQQELGVVTGYCNASVQRNEMGGEKSGVKLDESQDVHKGGCGGQHRLPRPKNRRRVTSEASRCVEVLRQMSPQTRVGGTAPMFVCAWELPDRRLQTDLLISLVARYAVCQGVGRGSVVPRWTKSLIRCSS